MIYIHFAFLEFQILLCKIPVWICPLLLINFVKNKYEQLIIFYSKIVYPFNDYSVIKRKCKGVTYDCHRFHIYVSNLVVIYNGILYRMSHIQCQWWLFTQLFQLKSVSMHFCKFKHLISTLRTYVTWRMSSGKILGFFFLEFYIQCMKQS
jgi:hypothetical protein